MKRTLSAVLTMTVLAVFETPAAAQTARPCEEDMAKYCSGIQPGGGRLLKCYEEQKMNMSSACVSWAEYLKQNASSLVDACSKTIEARCNFEKGDPLAMLNCLQSNYIDLQPKCVEQLNRFNNYYPKPAK